MSLEVAGVDEPWLEAGTPLPDKGWPPRRRRWRWWHLLLALVLLFGLLIGWLVWRAPLSRALEPLPTAALILTDTQGTPFARRGDYKETPVEIAKLPPYVIDAVLSIEDRRFYDHVGVDPRGLVRAFLNNVEAGGVVQGGSTITQQLAKTSFLTLERSYRRKAQEIIIALWLEAWLTKDEILSRYLSSVYFGDGAFGLRAAARTYFDRAPEQLTVAQAAMLAGIIKAPSAMAPSRHLKRAQERAKVVLAAMIDNGKLTAAEAARIRPAIYHPGRSSLPAGSYFGDWVLPQARAAIDSPRFGETRVRTTLDPELQRQAERVIRRALKGPGTWLGADQAALVAMRPDGRVVAMVGGLDYEANQYNRAAQALRQPGSAFKLFVYLAALRAGRTLDSTVEDRPLQLDDWAPKNDEGKYRGTVGLRTAFAASSNVAAVRLAQEVGTGKVIAVARELGVKSDLTPWPALALGTSRMTLLELTAAYAGVAAGHPVTPTGLPPRGQGDARQSLPERAAMLELLNSAVRNGTGEKARLPGLKAYGKTGTTQNHRDALFVGFAGDLIVGIWVGNDDNRPMNGVTGGGLPAQIWHDYMMAALPQLRAAPQPEPAATVEPDDDAATLPDEAQARLDAAIDAVEAAGDLVSGARDGPVDTGAIERVTEAAGRLEDPPEEIEPR